MAELARRVRITGRVQGVGFRAWAAHRAEDLGISGWIRNEEDGSVSALIAGQAADVGRMIGELRSGPRMALVARVEEAPGEAPEQSGFAVLR